MQKSKLALKPPDSYLCSGRAAHYVCPFEAVTVKTSCNWLKQHGQISENKFFAIRYDAKTYLCYSILGGDLMSFGQYTS